MNIFYKIRDEVSSWLIDTWNVNYLMNRRERGMRMAEEALELAQCSDVTREEAHALVDQVFDKPTEPNAGKEIAGCLVCLVAAAVAHDVNILSAYEEEKKHRWSNQAKIRAKHKNKPVKTTEEERAETAS